MAGTVAYGEAYARGGGRRKEPWTAQVVAGGVQVTYADEPGAAKYSGARGEHLPSPAQLLSQYCGDLLLAAGRRLLQWSPTIRMEPELVGAMPGQITAICPKRPLAGDSRGNIRLWHLSERRGNSYPVSWEMGLTAPIISLGEYDSNWQCARGCLGESSSRLLVGVPNEVLLVDLRQSAILSGFPVTAPPRLLVGGSPKAIAGSDQGVLMFNFENEQETVLLAATDGRGRGRYRPTALASGWPHILAAVHVTDPAGDDAGTELFRWDWSGKVVRRERVAPPQSAEVVHIVPDSYCSRSILLIDSAGDVHEASA